MKNFLENILVPRVTFKPLKKTPMSNRMAYNIIVALNVVQLTTYKRL